MKKVNTNQISNPGIHHKTFRYFYLIPLIIYCSMMINGNAQNTSNMMSQPELTIPFEYDGRIVIPIKVNGSKELDIIFDSGLSQAKMILLTHKEIIDELGLKITKTTAGARGAGSGKNVKIHLSANNQISLDKLILNNMMVAVMDQTIDSSLFHNAGVVGNALLLNHVVGIDFDLREFKLYNSENFKPDNSWEELPIDIEKNLTILNTTISIDGKNNKLVKLIVDTGGRGGLALTTGSANHLTKPDSTIYKLTGTGFRGAIYGDQSRVAKIKFGTHLVKDELASWIPITEVPILQEISGDGVIGIDFLRRFNLILDLNNHRIFIKPNKSLNKVSDINMAGLSIVEMGSGKRIIFHVIEDSQAFKKDIRAGDELIKINNVLVSSLNMFQLEELFKKEGSIVNLEFLREGEIVNKRIKLKRFI